MRFSPLLGFILANIMLGSLTLGFQLAVIPAALGQEPSQRLVIHIGPPSLPADGSAYPIMVQLQGPSAAAVPLAKEEIVVRLSSSNVNIGTISQPTITIQAQSNYATTNFITTSNPGNTTITASASGYVTGSLEVTTKVPGGYPSKLALFFGPKTLLPDPAERGLVVVQLQDARGNPARAPATTRVTLSSSQTEVGTVDSFLTISEGETSGSANFSPTFFPGKTTVTASASGYVTAAATIETVGTSPTRLTVTVAPSRLPADGVSFVFVFVQLQGVGRTPARAPSPIQVTLTSSNVNVGNFTKPEINIAAGNTYALARLFSKGGIGSTSITASAPGYTSGFLNITSTSTAFTPYGLSLSLQPNPILPDGRLYNGSAVVQIVNRTGVPVPASNDVTVSLSSSKVEIGTVSPTVTIKAGKTFGAANFSATFLAGKTDITASAPGLVSDVRPMDASGSVPSQLAVFSAPKILPANGKSTPSILVQLQDAQGSPVKAPSDIAVHLSSYPAEVGTAQTPITIAQNSTYGIANFASTFVKGAMDITASASGYSSGYANFTTIEPFPSRLAVYIAPKSFHAASGEHTSIVVQLQDSRGVPAKATSTIKVFLASASTAIAVPSPSVDIPAGSTYAAAGFKTGTAAGTTNITASADGYTTGVASLRTVHLPLEVSLILSRPAVYPGDRITASAVVTSSGLPLAGATLVWSAGLGTLSVTTSTTGSDGRADTTYLAKAMGVDTITVSASKPGHNSSSTTASAIIQNPNPLPIDFNLLLLILGGVVAVIVVVTVVLVRRRRGGGEEYV